MKKYIMLSILIFLIGCSDERTLQELHQIALSCKDNAQKAREAKDPDKAEEEAEISQEIAEELEERFEDVKDVSESDLKLKEEILLLANKTNHIADLALEDEELSDILSSWKAAAYRKTRLLTIKGLFLGLALATDQAESKGIDKLPEKVQESAEWSGSLVYEYTGRGKLKNGDPDWKEISKVLREFAKVPPVELPVILAVGYTSSTQMKLGLYEIELLDSSKIKDNDRKLIFQVIRSVILSMNGFTNLAVESLEKTINETANTTLLDSIVSDGTITEEDKPKVILSIIHLIMGYLHFEDRKYEEADRDVVRAMKVWPNNPLTVFLTGELLLENGKKEEAAESLEKAAATVEGEWLAKVIAQRAKEIRDGKGKDESLIYNSKVIGGILLTLTIDKAKISNMNPSLVKWMELLRDYAGKLMGFEVSVDTGNEKKEEPVNR